MPLIGALWVGMAALLAQVLPKITYRVLGALGLSIAVFAGLGEVTDQLETFIAGQFGSLSATAFQAVGALKIDDAISMIISAYAFKATVVGTKAFFKKTA